jgi:hypothetical protein
MSDYNKAFNMQAYPPNMKPGQRYDINIGASSTDTIPAVLVVDSSERDRAVYENPGRYRFQLIKQYRDVISMELIQANIPHSFYSINNNNNKITVESGGNTYVASITPGNYNSITTLMAVIKAVLDATASALTFTVAQANAGGNAVLNKLVISAGGPFKLLAGQPNNADTILGLGSVSIDSTADNITMPNCYVMHPYRYLILEVRGMERCDGNSSALMNSFCIIPVDTASDNFGILKNGDTIDNDTFVFHFTEPLPKLADLEITVRTPDGNICEFNGRDHFFVFEIKSLSRPHKC